MSTKRNQNEVEELNSNVYADVQWMNTFTPSANYDLDYVVLLGKRTQDCVSVDVDIYLADAGHEPTGSSLANVEVLQAAIGTNKAEITFTFSSSLLVTSGLEYCIVVSCAGPDVSNSFQWRYGFSNTGYKGSSTDGGSTWEGITSSQGFWFQAWGSDPLTEATLTQQTNLIRLVAVGNNEVWYEDI